MGSPHAILCVPTKGDPGGLLKVGPSLRLPAGPDIAVTRCAHPPRIVFHGSREDALPLWWDGALVPEGWDRYVRVLLTALGGQDDYPVSRWPTADGVLAAASAGTSLCRVVVLDLVDGALVERAP